MTTIFLWIVGVLTLVLTDYGIFTGVALTLPFPYDILIVINSAMTGIVEIFVGALIDMHAKRSKQTVAEFHHHLCTILTRF